jgi:hypothetical protein
VKGSIAFTTSAQFASGAEDLKLEVEAKGLATDEVFLRVFCNHPAPNTKIFERKLTSAERADGKRTILWNGKANTGADSGKFVGPANSPYKLVLQIAGGKGVARLSAVKVAELLLTKPTHTKFFMNTPGSFVLAEASVQLTTAAGGKAKSAAPIKVRFTFSDPGNNNATKAASFVHAAPAALGKRSDAAAVFWKAASAFATTSVDSFNKSCDVVTRPSGAEQGKAQAKFLPAGVGGDDYKLTAEVLAADGTTSLVKVDGTVFQVLRRIQLKPFEMTGQTHISTHGTDAKMATYYTAATFVRYSLGAVTTIAATFSIRYIGLWDHATQAMLNWATSSAKTATETPSAADTTAANGPAASPAQVAAQLAARAAIQVQANAWRDRLIADYNAGLNSWAPDASVPVDSLVAIEFEHPKYSAGAPDSLTTEWTAFPWLRITVEGNSIHPDARWVNGQGVAFGQRAYVTSGMGAARTEVVIAHEAGHETKNQFKRKPFGAGDHTAGAGLMDPFASQSSFTAGEIDILKGLA